jgi:hypothetical protein
MEKTKFLRRTKKSKLMRTKGVWEEVTGRGEKLKRRTGGNKWRRRKEDEKNQMEGEEKKG